MELHEPVLARAPHDSRALPTPFTVGALMQAVLRLEGPDLDANLRGMWRTLLDHTSCVHSTAYILEEIARARRSGKVDYCLVFRLEPGEGYARALNSWAIHVVHTTA